MMLVNSKIPDKRFGKAEQETCWSDSIPVISNNVDFCCCSPYCLYEFQTLFIYLY